MARTRVNLVQIWWEGATIEQRESVLREFELPLDLAQKKWSVINPWYRISYLEPEIRGKLGQPLITIPPWRRQSLRRQGPGEEAS